MSITRTRIVHGLPLVVNRLAPTLVALTLVTLAAPAVHAQQPPCIDAQTREQIRSTMMDALDQALRSHIARLFDGWMRDATQQPVRAQTGLNEAMRAYLFSREAALKWQPPPCR